MRIFDCTILNDELDMLALRMAVLEDAVDTFIVAESPRTHSGQPKPLHLRGNLDQFARWGDRLHVVTVDLTEMHSWLRERQQRGALADGLKAAGATEYDLVIVADVDEIPRPEAVRAIDPIIGARLELDLYYYNLHTRVMEGWSIGALPYGVESDPNAIRTLAGHDVPTIYNAGWHFSYFGGAERISGKMDAFMHHADIAANAPRDPAWIQTQIDRGEDLYGRALRLQQLDELDMDLPAVLLNDPAYRGWF